MSDYIVIHGIRIAKDFTPETFGRLTTKGPKFRLPIGNKSESKSYQVCECTCGTVKVVGSGCLKSGNTQSCGCFDRQRTSERSTKHRLSRIPEYGVWSAMKDRCGNIECKDYQYYGGRGIRVCVRWLERDTGFMNFYSDMGPRPSDKHSIDRINNDGNYCPENCRWVTRSVQNRNQRSNLRITYNGKTQGVTEWADDLGLKRNTIVSRLKAGWTVEKTLTTKVK
jgi:hypothetical protein